MSVDPDSLSRTAKILLDSGDARSIEEAHATLESFVLQVYVGRGIAGNRSRQAALLTVVNAAARAFEGGVFVHVLEDATVDVGWYCGKTLVDAVRRCGGILVVALGDEHPTICVGEPSSDVRGRPILRATFDGWTGGVVEGAETPLAERDTFVPAGIAAAGIAVAEAFEFRRGKNIYAGRRSQGLSLWKPDAAWLSAAALGPGDVSIAPSSWWIVGLGHLGQGYLWSIGMLPYAMSSDVRLMLQDDDFITKANESTGLLLESGWKGRRKTRVLADVLEAQGFNTTITERRLQLGHGPTGDEPRLALIGVDNPETRLRLSDADFEFVVDAGLGGGPVHYLAMQLHTFPSGRASDEITAWKQTRSRDESLLALPAYQRMTETTGDECGTIEVAGRSVAAAFVGATAGALVIAEATRALLGAHRYSVIDASLNDLGGVRAAEAVDAPVIANTGFARLR